jgi:hAT family C-terminal dimerisation region
MGVTGQTRRNVFDRVDDVAAMSSDEEVSTMDQELELYLGTKPDKNVADPIHWWVEKQQSYPCLSRMAIDFLTIPGEYCSISDVRLLITSYRHLN